MTLRVRTARAFTLIEVVVALVVVLVLAAVALPNVNGYLQQKRVDSAVQQLTTVANAITTFRTNVGANPGRLSELSTIIIASNAAYNTGTDDSCGGAFTNGERNGWNGPYINFLVDRDSGMVTAVGMARDSLTRIPNSATAGVLRINFINSVALEDAVLIDQTADGSTGNAAGYVTWVLPAVNGLVTMYASVPVNNAC